MKPLQQSSPLGRTGRYVLALLAVVLVAGCVTPFGPTPFRAPADVAHIRLERQDSAQIALDKIWLERKSDGLFVTGYVRAQEGVTDTTGSRLLVSIRDERGKELRALAGDFEPRQIPLRVRMPYRISRYRVHLDPMPPDAATIVVAARDDRVTP